MSDFYEQGLMPVSARMDAYTEEGVHTAGIVDELFEESDRGVYNILHAMAGTAIGEVWDTDSAGQYVRAAKAPATEAITVAIDGPQGSVGYVALNGAEKPHEAIVIQLAEERARRRSSGGGSMTDIPAVAK